MAYLQVPLKDEQANQLTKYAEQEGRTKAQIVRELLAEKGIITPAHFGKGPIPKSAQNVISEAENESGGETK